MIIEIQSGAFIPKDEKQNEAGGKGVVIAFTNYSDIFLTPTDTYSLLINYWHEAGHIIGRQLSFLHNDVLTPDEAIGMSVDLTSQEIGMFLKNKMFPAANPKIMSGGLQRFAEKVLLTFSKDNIDVYNIRVFHKTQSEIAEMISNGEFPQLSTTKDGKTEVSNSSWSRNIELSAMATQVGCQFILENTLRNYKILSVSENFIIHSEGKTGHTRALNVAARFYQKDWGNPPSQRDLTYLRRI